MEKESKLSKKELSSEEQEHYEDITRESLFRIRALYPLMDERASLDSDERLWGLESWRGNKEEFLTFIGGTGKTLEYYGTSEKELQCLEKRVEAIHWLNVAKRSQEVGSNKIGKGEVERIIDAALKSVGSSLEEINELQKRPKKGV